MAAVSSNVVQVARVIRGHHVLKQIWTPVIGEELHLEQEIGNPYYHFAVAVKKDSEIVERVPRELSKCFWKFLESEGKFSVW